MRQETTRTNSPLAQKFTRLSLLRFAAPSIAMMLVIALYTVTDGIFIGRYAGSDALAASNVAYPAVNLIWGIGIMLASGGSALVAKNLGEGRNQEARARFTMLAIVAALLPLAISLFYFAAAKQILSFLGAAPALYAMCYDYLMATLPFFPAGGLMLFFNAFFIADGRPMQGFFVSVASGVTNAVLDYVFLAHLGLGIFGAGLATGLAYLVAAVAGLLYFARYARTLRFTRPAFEPMAFLAAMGNGSSELVTQLSMGITTFLFNVITFRYAGADGIAAITVILYAEMLLTAVYVGYTTGVAPIFSYQYGAENFREIRRLLKKSAQLIAGSALLVFAIAELFAAPLTTLFLPEGGHALELATTGFMFFSFSFLLSGANIFLSGFFTALSDGKTSALLSFTRNLAGISLFLLTLPELLGITGAWIAVPAADIVALALGCILTAGRLSRKQYSTKHLRVPCNEPSSSASEKSALSAPRPESILQAQRV